MNPSFTKGKAALSIGFAGGAAGVKGVSIIGFRAVGSQYGQYDDTLAFITPDQYLEYKANTMPSIWQPGVAKLMPGTYTYKKGLHGISHLVLPEDQKILDWLNANIGKDYPANLLQPGKLIPYWAFRQNGPVLLQRDGASETEMDKWPSNPAWIDIHHGGYNLTSSLGCQTIHPDWWIHFRERIYAAMDQYKQESISYHLIQLAA